MLVTIVSSRREKQILPTSEGRGNGGYGASLLGREQNPPVGMARRDLDSGKPRRELLRPLPSPHCQHLRRASITHTVTCMNLYYVEIYVF